ncbi:MAG: histidine phosphatase family protein [Actinomycetota bacterium]|nr:histidine phosphatase family protein [Actinomycetota bacterium]
MTVLLVRHAHAGSREKWQGPGPDEVRPLSKKGWRQARGLVEVLEGYDIARLLSSPYVRCVQTLEPLAAVLGVEIEAADELAEGADPRATRDLVRVLGDTTAALSSHGDVLPNLLDLLIAEDGLDLPPDYPCAKGSTWVLRDDRGRLTAEYLPPPAE